LDDLDYLIALFEWSGWAIGVQLRHTQEASRPLFLQDRLKEKFKTIFLQDKIQKGLLLEGVLTEFQDGQACSS
jgi:hypothetical protein